MATPTRTLAAFVAAELAARGFTGPTAVLEYEDDGFCHAVSDASNLEL